MELQKEQALDVSRLRQIAGTLAAGEAESLGDEDWQLGAVALSTLLHIIEALQTWRTTAKTLRAALDIPEPQRPKPKAKNKNKTREIADKDEGDVPKGVDDDSAAENEDKETLGTTATDHESADGTDGVDESAPNRDEHGRTHPDEYPGAESRNITHPELHHGDQCPLCTQGRLYERVRSFLSISGQPSYKATNNHVHELQCYLCDGVVRPPIPPELAADGVGSKNRYTYSAAAVTVLEKFLAGTPWHRLEMLQGAYGIKVPDSSMFDMCERVANIGRPVVKVLIRLAANRSVLHADDTGVLVLMLRSAQRPDRKTGVLVERTGSHTTCILAPGQAPGETDIVLYFSGIHHAGEKLDSVLTHRDIKLPPPIVMTDGLAANAVTVCETITANCNAHAFRKFKDIKKKYPTEYAQVASLYDVLFTNDAQTKPMSADERLQFHQDNSKQAFDELIEYLKDLEPEPNSDFGKACDYVLNREEALGRFLSTAGAPLHNNSNERQMRPPVRIRDACRFHLNSAGSGIAAVLLTLIITALVADANVFDFLVALQRYASDVAENPERWLPWSYKERIAELEVSAPRDKRRAA